MDKELLKIIKDMDPDYEGPDEHVGWIDTGSYIFNAAISASIYGGVSDNAISTFHAKEGVGKTYFAMSAVKEFLDTHKDGAVIYFDTEGATKSNAFKMRGIDYDRVKIREPETIERTQAMVYKFLSGIRSHSNRPPILMVLDSYGMLPSSKERADIESGKEVKDMTKQSAGRALFRTITSDLRKLRIPFIVNGHCHTDVMSYGAPQVLSGGGGLKYASSIIAYLAKSKDKEEVMVNGKKVTIHNANIIKVHVQKSRFTKEDTKIETKLDFNTGIDRYYGLLDLASQYNIVKKVSTQYEMPDGSKHFKKHIDAEPIKYFNAELLAKIEEAANQHFRLGSQSRELELTESKIESIEEFNSEDIVAVSE